MMWRALISNHCLRRRPCFASRGQLLTHAVAVQVEIESNSRKKFMLLRVSSAKTKGGFKSGSGTGNLHRPTTSVGSSPVMMALGGLLPPKRV